MYMEYEHMNNMKTAFETTPEVLKYTILSGIVFVQML